PRTSSATPGEDRPRPQEAYAPGTHAVVRNDTTRHRAAREGRPRQTLSTRPTQRTLQRSHAAVFGGSTAMNVLLGHERTTKGKIRIPKESFRTHWHLIGGTG